jgi:tetratricopeptide (TPR) repeat protein
VNGDFLVAFSLGINEAAAASLFNGLDKVLIVYDEVWLPVSMNSLNSGFTAAWGKAVTELNETFEAGEDAAFNILKDCWALYPPAPFPALGVRIAQPETAAFSSGAVAAVNGYIAQEIEPLVRVAQRTAQSSPTGVNYNRLGIVQIRAGRTAEAKAAFERAVGMGSVPAMTNRGILALLEKDYTAAERWFSQALAAQPGNRTAVRGLEQAQGNR